MKIGGIVEVSLRNIIHHHKDKISPPLTEGHRLSEFHFTCERNEQNPSH